MSLARLLATVDLSGVAITVRIATTEVPTPTVAAEGARTTAPTETAACARRPARLQAVGGMVAKWKGALRAGATPRVHTVVFAREQRAEVEAIAGEWLATGPEAPVRALFADTLADLGAQLVAAAAERWPAVLESRDVLDRYRRAQVDPEVRERVEAAIEARGPEGGYVLVNGAPGTGKTALIAACVREAEAPVVQVLERERQDRDDPARAVRSLAAQVRRKYGIAPRTARGGGPDSGSAVAASAELMSVLEAVSAQLEPGQREVLYVDGLDAAFGPGARFEGLALPTVMPVPPRRIVMVVTSRPGSHLRWLADATEVRLEREYPPAGREEAESSAITRERDAARGEVLKVLGLVACAREPLSRAHLQEMFGPKLARRMGQVLTLAREFLEDGPGGAGNARLSFYHTQFQEFVLGQVGEAAPRRHAELAASCARVFRRSRRRTAAEPSAPRPEVPMALTDYTLYHRLTHLVGAREWKGLVRAFGDSEFIVAAGKRFGFGGAHAALLAGARTADAESGWREGLAGFERFLRWRIDRLPTLPEVYAQEVCNEFLLGVPRRWREALEPLRRGSGSLLEVRLRKRSGPATLGTVGHTNEVTRVAFSPDGHWVVSSSEDGSVRVWEATTGAAVAAGVGHTDQVRSVAFSPDGQRVVSGSRDGTVGVWEASTGALVAAGVGHTGAVNCLAFSPDGRRVVSGSSDGKVQVWEAATGALVAAGVGHAGGVLGVAFLPDGQRVVSASWDGTMRVWEAATGARLTSVSRASARQPLRGVTSVAFAPDGARIAWGNENGTVVMVGVLEAPTQLTVPAGVVHDGRVVSLAFSLDGTRVVSGGADGKLRVWEAATGKAVTAGIIGHDGYVFSVAFSPDGTHMVSGGADRTVRVWKVVPAVRVWVGRTGPEVTIWGADGVKSVAFAPDGQRVASGGADGTVRVWDVATGAVVAAGAGIGYSQRFRSAAISPDGRLVVSSNLGGRRTASVWEAATGAVVAVGSEVGHSEWVYSVAFSEDGARVVSGDIRGTVRVWEVATGLPVAAEYVGHDGFVMGVAFSPDGECVVSGGADKTVRVWEAATGEAVAACVGHTDWVLSVAFSPDGALVVSGGKDGTARVWDAATGVGIAQCVGNTGRVNSVAFSADGARVVSGGDDKTVRVWEAATGVVVAECVGHTETVTSVAFSPDGRRVVSSSDDRTVRVWDTATGDLVDILFFDASVGACHVVGPVDQRGSTTTPEPSRLVVVDVFGRTFTYDVIDSTWRRPHR